jgi:hypothetical protein
LPGVDLLRLKRPGGRHRAALPRTATKLWPGECPAVWLDSQGPVHRHTAVQQAGGSVAGLVPGLRRPLRVVSACTNAPLGCQHNEESPQGGMMALWNPWPAGSNTGSKKGSNKGSRKGCCKDAPDATIITCLEWDRDGALNQQDRDWILRELAAKDPLGVILIPGGSPGSPWAQQADAQTGYRQGHQQLGRTADPSTEAEPCEHHQPGGYCRPRCQPS